MESFRELKREQRKQDHLFGHHAKATPVDFHEAAACLALIAFGWNLLNFATHPSHFDLHLDYNTCLSNFFLLGKHLIIWASHVDHALKSGLQEGHFGSVITLLDLVLQRTFQQHEGEGL